MNRPVETRESDIGNRTEPGIEEEQDELERGGEEGPVQRNQEEPDQQPIQPEIGREAGKERETNPTRLRPGVGLKCKALSHGRAMCWPVRSGRTSGKPESDIEI